MKKKLYVILVDQYEDLGEGYSSGSYDRLLGIVTSFETARNIIEYLAETIIGEENPGYEHCNGCKKGYCGDCLYNMDGEVIEENWDSITLEAGHGVELTYKFKTIEVEV